MRSGQFFKILLDLIRPLKVAVRQDLQDEHFLNGSRILDYGCGRGPFHKMLADLGSNVFGIDISPSPSAQYIFEDNLIPRDAGSFDAVIVLDVLQHLRDPDASLADIASVLSPGGHLYLTVPFLYPNCDYEDFQRWTKQGVINLVSQQGFTVCWVK